MENMVLRIWEFLCENCDGWFSESPYEKRAVRCVQVDISSVRRNWNGQWSRTTLRCFVETSIERHKSKIFVVDLTIFIRKEKTMKDNLFIEPFMHTYTYCVNIPMCKYKMHKLTFWTISIKKVTTWNK